MDNEWPELNKSNQLKLTKKASKLAFESKTKTSNYHKDKRKKSTRQKSVNMKIVIEEFNEKFANEFSLDGNEDGQVKPYCSMPRECVSIGNNVEESFKSIQYYESIMCVRINLLYFYFSETNLRKDFFMLKNMNQNGWIPIQILLDFPRMKRTRATADDILNISLNLVLPPFTVNGEFSGSSFLQFDKANDMIRRCDMDNIELTLQAFRVTKKITLQLEMPYPNHTFSFFETELEPFIETYVPRPMSEISVNRVEVNNDNLTFEFGNSVKAQVPSKRIYRKKRTTMESSSDLDENNLYLITLKGTTPDWHEISDTDSIIENTYPDTEKRIILKKSLQETFNTRTRYQSCSSCSSLDSQNESDSCLPDSEISIEEKMAWMNINNNPSVLIHKMKPLSQDNIDYSFLNESCTWYCNVPNDALQFDYSIQYNNKLDNVDKLLDNVIFEYQNTITPSKPVKILPKPKPTTKVKKSINHLNFYESDNDEIRPTNDPMMGYILNKNRRKRASSSNSYSQYRDSGKTVAKGLENPHKNHVGEILLNDDFKLNLYLEFKETALSDRKLTGCGRSAEMNALFRFWSFFLRENFQKKMYKEFQELAWEDAEHGYRYGVECVFRMFSYKLENKERFNMNEYKDFQNNVFRDLKMNSLYGLEKFWALKQYGNLTIEALDEIEEKLKEYKTLEDFRKNFIPPQGFYGYKIIF